MKPDTIVALATPPGPSATALVRISGDGARSVLGQVAPDCDPSPRVATLAHVIDGTGERIERALVTWFERPNSYTGEDVVEISGHGGTLGPRLVLDACLEAGARLAEPGEFTRRAYLNGKLDLVQAESILDLIEGDNAALRSAAMVQLDRGLSARLADLRAEIVRLEALLMHHIDFPEEDEPPVPITRIVAEVRALSGALRHLLETAPEGRLLRNGALVVLAGPPNAGKSSLFNALVGEERVIVTDVPGTTRDAVEAAVSIGGYPFRLVDTAGLRDEPDEIERLGIEVSRRYLARADVVLYCQEGTGDGPAERFLKLVDAPVVRVRTKVDAGVDSGTEGGPEDGVVDVSAHTGRGLGELKSRLRGLVFSGVAKARAEELPVLTRARQIRGVGEAARELDAFAAALNEGVPPDVASAHLKPAETALEELLGVISQEEVLDRVFRDFCVGK